jgi:rod shape-determining protein MreD
VRSAAALAAILIAIALQTTLARYIFRDSSTVIDLVLIVVVYVAIKSGPVTGLLAGTVAGLIQDAQSGGVLGIGGLAKTMVGFLSGLLGTQFIVTAPLPRFLLLVVATALHEAIFIGLYTMLNLRQYPSPYSSVVGQAFGNAFVGVVAFQMIEWFPGFVDRRRAGRFLKR